MQAVADGAISPGVTAPPAQLRLDLRSAPALDRGAFAAGPSNAEALRRLGAWRNWPAGALALVGPEGVGKSHLAAVWAAEAHAVTLAADTPSRRFPEPGRPALVEDADRDADDQTLFHLINRAARGEGALLLTGRSPPVAWPAALPDLRSRLNALATVEIAEPDDAVFEALLLKLFRERSARPSPDLLRYLARRVERSALAAREVVERLDAAAEDGRIGLGLARRVLGDEQADLPLGEGPGDDPLRD